MALHFVPKTPIDVSFDFQAAAPDRLQMLSHDQILRLKLQAGSTKVEIGEAWNVEGDAEDGCVVIEGGCENARLLASGMKSGKLVVQGHLGDHALARMSGGAIEIEGPVGDWLGAEMTGGVVKVRGTVGEYAGSAYPGSRLGMKDGAIFVEGSCGDNLGVKMRSGLIAIASSAGECVGRSMIAGSIFVFGSIGNRIGLGMKRGSIVLLGAHEQARDCLLPTFTPSGSFRPHFLKIYLDFIGQNGFACPGDFVGGSIERYNGDLADSGKGEVLVWSNSD